MSYIESYLHYLTYEKRYSALSIRSYQIDLKQFESFLHSFITKESFSWSFVDHKYIRQFIGELSSRGLTNRTINRKLSAIRSFFKYLLREEVISNNPFNKVVVPKTTKRLPVFVEEKNMEDLLDGDYFNNDYAGRRNQLIIELFYQTGMRLSELINLRKSDIDQGGASLKVLGKRNKQRIIPVSKELLKKVNCFIADFDAKPTAFLLLTDKGNKLYPKMVYRIVNKHLALVSTIEKKSPHVLRHTFATHLLNRGADINAIKEIMGHANLAATQVYTHNTFKKLKSIYKQAHPRA